MNNPTQQKLINTLAGKATLLAIGPMSKNSVDVTIELANSLDIPITLIASRRQIECAELGGGYVNNWTTPEFIRYVSSRDIKKNIIIGRDHAGPWQNPLEKSRNLSLREAMESAKMSLKVDIESGMQFLHLDPTLDPERTPLIEENIDRIFELYSFCASSAQRLGREILFEVGPFTSNTMDTPEELEYGLDRLARFCRVHHLPLPTFVVLQTGTLVMETRNVGSFENLVNQPPDSLSHRQLKRMLTICERYGILAKEHNTDYLSDKALSWHPQIGIHSANIAPELGIVETTTLLSILEEIGETVLLEDFISLAVASDKWRKWMLAETIPTPRELAVIAGHYVFSDPRCVAIKDKARQALSQRGADLDERLKQAIRERVMRYLKLFNLAEDKTPALL